MIYSENDSIPDQIEDELFEIMRRFPAVNGWLSRTLVRLIRN
jgi:hypothetical protein